MSSFTQRESNPAGNLTQMAKLEGVGSIREQKLEERERKEILILQKVRAAEQDHF